MVTIDEWRVLLHQRLFFYKYAKVHYIFIMSQNGILRIKEFTSNFNENQREICKKTLYYITVWWNTSIPVSRGRFHSSQLMSDKDQQTWIMFQVNSLPNVVIYFTGDFGTSSTLNNVS